MHFNLSDKTVSLSVILGTGIVNLAPVKVTAVKCLNENFRSCDIGCNGDIVKVTHSHHFCLLLVICGRRAGILKVKKKIYFIVSKTGSYLLLAAVLTCKQFFYFKTCCIGNIFSGDARSAEVVLGKNFSNLWLLTIVLTATFLAIAFSNGSLNYLSYKMDDPFINWVDIPNSYESSDMDGFEQALHLDEYKSKYHYRNHQTDKYWYQ